MKVTGDEAEDRKIWKEKKQPRRYIYIYICKKEKNRMEGVRSGARGKLPPNSVSIDQMYINYFFSSKYKRDEEELGLKVIEE